MKRIRIIGSCLAAVLALGAGVASSASAASLLARLSGGGSVVGTTFLAKAGLVRLETQSGKELHCNGVTYHGVFTGSTLGDALMRFLGCSAHEGITVNCNTAGAGIGEIHLPLSTTLFHLGLAHLGTSTTIPALATLPGTGKIECTKLVIIEVRGSVIGALQKENGEPVALNEARSELNLNFQQTATGVQHLRLILMPGSTTPTSYDYETSFSGGAFELMSVVENARLDGFTTSGGTATNIELVEP